MSLVLLLCLSISACLQIMDKLVKSPVKGFHNETSVKDVQNHLFQGLIYRKSCPSCAQCSVQCNADI